MWYRTPNNENMTEPYLYTEDNNYFTSGSPGTYTNSLSVAAAENGGHTGYPLRFGDRATPANTKEGHPNGCPSFFVERLWFLPKSGRKTK